MKKVSYLKDASFLRELDNQVNKFYWVRIEVLNKEEQPIQTIEGKVLPGSSINIDGNSSMRRTCSLNILAEDAVNDLTNIDNLLSINKKIRIFEGIKNEINTEVYEDIIWFPLGVFVINQPTINHTLNGCNISLSCKDKMCLLNGECGGNLPTSVTFHAYDQIIGERLCGDEDPEKIIDDPNNYTVYTWTDEKDGVKKYKTQTANAGQVSVKDNSAVGQRVEIKQLFYDIIQTLVCNYGGESLSKIFINDVPIEIKQLVRQTGEGTLYYNTVTHFYTTDESYLVDGNGDIQRKFNYNEDVGYIYTDFTYADMGGGNGELISNIGDNVCTILDKIRDTLGNFEYFYDINGNFIFQEVKNYLNNSYNAQEEGSARIDNQTSDEIDLTEYGLCIMDNINYAVDFYSNTKTVYTFEENSGLISAYTNTPVYTNLKNDYHIQGKTKDNYAIHYHLVIKDKPVPPFETRKVVFLEENGVKTGGLRLAADGEEGVDYVPADQRAELYLQGLEAQAAQIRPDVYQQELLDLFDGIYDFYKKSFKTNMITNPNILKYFIDYLEPSGRIFDCSVNAIGQRIISYQQDSIRKIYNMDVPDVILIDNSSDNDAKASIRKRCQEEGQAFSSVNGKLYAKIAIGTIGYTAQEVVRDLIYQYTNYAESITIQSIPIYYLEPNSRITVYDQKTGIYGDYIIKTISLPFDAGGQMSINAVRAAERF